MVGLLWFDIGSLGLTTSAWDPAWFLGFDTGSVGLATVSLASADSSEILKFDIDWAAFAALAYGWAGTLV